MSVRADFHVCVSVCTSVCVWLVDWSPSWSLSRPSLTLYSRRGRRTGFIKILSEGVCIVVGACDYVYMSEHLPQAQKRYHLSFDMFFHLAFFLLDRHYFSCQSFFFFSTPIFPQGQLYPLYCEQWCLCSRLFNHIINKMHLHKHWQQIVMVLTE